MKATGIVRRIDELGRIVIPKEIRKNLRIQVGENLEIYTDDNENIILKKYSSMSNICDLAQNLVDSINSIIGENVIIVDNEKVIAVNGSMKSILNNQQISEKLSDMIINRQQLLESNFYELSIKEETIRCSYGFSTIIVQGEAIGAIIVLSENSSITSKEFDLIKMVSLFLTKYLEQ